MDEQFANQEIFMDGENSMNISYQQYRSSDDINFFFGHLNKCRICFKNFDTAEDRRNIESCHRQTFHAVSGVQLGHDQNLSNYLCHDCADHLEMCQDFWKSHGEMQNRYVTFVQRQIFPEDDSDDQMEQESGSNESESSDEEIISIRECSVYVKRLSANEIQMHLNNDEDNQPEPSVNPEMYEQENSKGQGSEVHQQRHRRVENKISIPRPRNEMKRYICSFDGCDISFFTRGGARRHLRVIHKLTGDAYESHCKMLKLM